MATLATGPTRSRASLLGGQVGQSIGTGLIQGFGDKRNELKLIEQYDPVRQVLRERLGSAPMTTPGQQVLFGLTEDPVAFAKAMENPQTVAALTGTANLASGPQVEEDPVNKAIRFVSQAAQAEAQGDTIRPPLLRARAAQLLDMKPGDGPNLDMFVAVIDGEQVPVQRDPKEGTFKDLNGAEIELPDGSQLFELSELSSGNAPREMREDQNGILRFVDNQQPVFPGVETEGDDDQGDPQQAIFATRASTSSDVLGTLGSQFVGFDDRITERLPQGWKSEDRQRFEQATTDFITAVLRPESGAQINQSEFDDAKTVYIPRPGDSEAVLQQKAASRAAAIAGLELAAGSALEEVRNAAVSPTIDVNGTQMLIGSVITNAQGVKGILQPDGTIKVLEQ